MAEKLIVRKLSPKVPLSDRATSFVKRQPIPERDVVAEVVVDRPLRFAWFNFRNWAGHNDDRVIGETIASMRDSISEGTSGYEVVRVKSNGRERALKNWKVGAGVVLHDELKDLREQEAKRAKRSHDAEISEHKQTQKQLRNVGVAEKESMLARLVVAVPMGSADATVRHMFMPGRSAHALQRDLFGVYSRLQDGPMDPLNVFHGVGETVVEQIQKAQEGKWRFVVNNIFAANPRLNEGVSDISTVNKLTSRDGNKYKAHGVVYNASYDKLTAIHKPLPVVGGIFNALQKTWVIGRFIPEATWGQLLGNVLPNQSQTEVARDNHMVFTDKTAAIHARNVLESPIDTALGRMHQRTVAQAVVHALDSVPTDTKLTHAVESRIEELTKRVNGMTGGKLPNARKALNWLAVRTGFKKESKGSEAEESAKSLLETTRAEIAKTLKKPMSIAAYTEAMTRLGEAFLQLPGLSAKESVLWNQALKWGEYVMETYGLAKTVNTGRRTSAEDANQAA